MPNFSFEGNLQGRKKFSPRIYSVGYFENLAPRFIGRVTPAVGGFVWRADNRGEEKNDYWLWMIKIMPDGTEEPVNLYAAKHKLQGMG